MSADDPHLNAVAEAIADGADVDWDGLLASGSHGSDHGLHELKIIAAIAAVNRQLQDSHPKATLGEVLSAFPPSSPHGTGTPWGVLMVLEEVGSGSFGKVFRAWDPSLDHEVALKRVRLPMGTSRSEASSIVREGQLLARVRHENVVTVHGACEIAGEVGIWMDFVRGRTLDQIVRQDGPMSGPEATVVGESLCRGLAAVHQAGLLHRDIKASNVMREAGGRIVMLDFGAGIEAAVESDTRTLGMVGTPLYMAPELFERGSATVQSDLYGVGVLLFFLVTGTYPVFGQSVAQIHSAHRAGRRRLLSDSRADLPRQFVQVVERALCPHPADRYSTAGAMLLDFIQSEHPASRASPSAISPVSSRIVAAVAFGTIGLWTLGLVSSIAFNLTLGRVGEFGNESAVSYWVWGFRSLFGPAIVLLIASLAFGGVRLAGAAVWAMIGRFTAGRAWKLHARRIAGRYVDAITAAPGETVSRTIVAVQGVVVALWLWEFRDILDAATVSVATAAPGTLEPLRPGNDLERRLFVVSACLIGFAMTMMWAVVIPRLRFVDGRPNRLTIAAAYAFVALLALAYVGPYRIIYQNQAQRLVFDRMRCYEIGARQAEILMYCPDAPVPRNRIVSAGDPRLERTNIIESVFTRPE